MGRDLVGLGLGRERPERAQQPVRALYLDWKRPEESLRNRLSVL